MAFVGQTPTNIIGAHLVSFVEWVWWNLIIKFSTVSVTKYVHLPSSRWLWIISASITQIETLFFP